MSNEQLVFRYTPARTLRHHTLHRSVRCNRCNTRLRQLFSSILSTYHIHTNILTRTHSHSRHIHIHVHVRDKRVPFFIGTRVIGRKNILTQGIAPAGRASRRSGRGCGWRAPP
jgi:hypothetical protein